MAGETEYYVNWGQGDVSLDVVALPHVNADNDIVDLRVSGVVVISQTCDIVNGVAREGSPALIQVAGLVEQDPRFVEEVRKFRRPRYIYVPAVADRNLVGDLELAATYDRAILERWTRVPASADVEARARCSFALGRHRSRHAFPDSWAPAFSKLRDWVKGRVGKTSDEGVFIDAVEEFRVIGDDSDKPTSLEVLCIIAPSATPAQRNTWVKTMLPKMEGKFDKKWCSSVTFRLATTRELSAEEYLTSKPLDFEAMSRAANDDEEVAAA